MIIGEVGGYSKSRTVSQLAESRSMIAVYVLRSETSGRYYIGCAQDPTRRLLEHNSGTTSSTRGRGPWKTVYVEWHETLVLARRRETKLKSWRNPAYLEQRLGIGASWR